jgi:hypothetical protein
MKKTTLWLPLIATCLAVAGCANQKEPAANAITQIETSLSSLRADAEKYAASELQQVDSAVATLKSSLASGDYKAVLASAPAVTSQVSALQQTIATKRQQMEAAVAAASQQWQSLSAQVPQMVQAIQSRVDILSKSKKLPANISAETLQAAKDGLESMKSAWGEATTLFSAGNAVDAATKAQAIKEKGSEVMRLLGMNV